MKKKTTKNDSNVVGLAVLGATLAGLAATTYFFLGPKGKKNQKHAKAWVVKMKADVIEKLEMARDITEPTYHEIIDSLAAKYEKGMKASHEEVTALAQDLKKHWKTISSGARAVKGDVADSAKKRRKTAAKKVATE